MEEESASSFGMLKNIEDTIIELSEMIIVKTRESMEANRKLEEMEERVKTSKEEAKRKLEEMEKRVNTLEEADEVKLASNERLVEKMIAKDKELEDLQKRQDESAKLEKEVGRLKLELEACKKHKRHLAAEDKRRIKNEQSLAELKSTTRRTKPNPDQKLKIQKLEEKIKWSADWSHKSRKDFIDHVIKLKKSLAKEAERDEPILREIGYLRGIFPEWVDLAEQFYLGEQEYIPRAVTPVKDQRGKELRRISTPPTKKKPQGKLPGKPPGKSARIPNPKGLPVNKNGRKLPPGSPSEDAPSLRF